MQYPADDVTASWQTTHFNFHDIDENVLKLDILGHDDPTMIRKLQDLSGIDPITILLMIQVLWLSFLGQRFWALPGTNWDTDWYVRHSRIWDQLCSRHG